MIYILIFFRDKNFEYVDFVILTHFYKFISEISIPYLIGPFSFTDFFVVNWLIFFPFFSTQF